MPDASQPLPAVIRAFRSSDRDACLAVFDSNRPKYFADDERAQFDAFLADHGADYLVAESDGRIVGCGGTQVRDGAGHLCWGMVARSHHGSSIGAALLRRRVDRLFREADIGEIRIDTSQHVAGFFARFGFRTREVVADGLAAGLDLVKMSLDRGDWAGRGDQGYR